MELLAAVADRLLRPSPVRRAALRAVGRRSLVLLFHRVGPDGPEPHEVVPTVPVDLLRRQLQALVQVGEVVPLTELHTSAAGGRPRFALTFDDDDPGHVEHALPLLRELDLPATFFLSARWEHGLGPYWWEVLEEQVRRDGLAPTAARHGRPEVPDATSLAAAIQDTPASRELAASGARQEGRSTMGPQDAIALRDAGMSIGFHTVEHRVMTSLSEEDLDRAVVHGRAELSARIGLPVGLFAYPHGRATRREAAAVARSGFDGAWTTAHRPTVATTDRHLRGRWEPGLLEPDAVVRGAVQRLLRPPVGEERG